MFKPMIKLTLLVASVLAVPTAFAAAMPPLPVETLTGTALSVPGGLPPGPCLLVVGFSHASQTPVTAWMNRLDQAQNRAAGVAVYQVAILEDVPSFIRGFVRRSIRGDTPKSRRDHFLVATTGEKEWKGLAGYQAQAPDTAYLLLLDKEHNVAWHQAGAVSRARYAALVKQLATTGTPAQASADTGSLSPN